MRSDHLNILIVYWLSHANAGVRWFKYY